MKRKWILLLFLTGSIVLTGIGNRCFAREKFPTRPISIIVPWGAGGSTSIQTRVIAQKMTEILNTPVLVINKPGGGATLGMEFASKSKPDGYTLIQLNTSTLVCAPYLIKGVGYTLDDFEYLGMHSVQSMTLAVNSKSPWKTLGELVAYAKEHPGELKYVSPGIGSASHIATEMFNKAANIKTVHVPMKSSVEMTSAILGGHVQFTVLYIIDVKPFLLSGKLRGLAAVFPRRIAEFPDMPTIAELGFPQVHYYVYYSLAAPKGLPSEVSNILKDAIAKASQDKDVVNAFIQLGVTPEYKPANEFRDLVYKEAEMTLKFLKELFPQ